MLKKKNKVLKGYTFIDLFAGIGGFHLGLESLGATCVYANEWNLCAQQIYEKNFGMIPEGDITKIDEKKIPNHDILCAGFPCQAFSISGKMQGFNDSRGTLFFDVARIVKEKQPKVVFMENVKNLLVHDQGNTFKVIKNIMEELGYVVYYQVLNASDYGVPQKRERVYIVCFREDMTVENFSFPTTIPLDKTVKSILLSPPEINSKCYVNRSDITITSEEDYIATNKVKRLGYVNKGGQGERIYSIYGSAITLSSYGGGVFSRTGGYLVDNRYRRLMPRESARLMGFPDSFELSSNFNQVYTQLGNAVVVDVIQYIGIEISKIL